MNTGSKYSVQWLRPLKSFQIHPGDDLQSYDNREKAATLLGFLIECFEKNDFDKENLERWRREY